MPLLTALPAAWRVGPAVEGACAWSAPSECDLPVVLPACVCPLSLLCDVLHSHCPATGQSLGPTLALSGARYHCSIHVPRTVYTAAPAPAAPDAAPCSRFTDTPCAHRHSDVAFFGNVSFTNNQAAYGGGLYVTTNTQLCGLLPDSCGRFKVALAGYFNSNNSAIGGTGSAVYSDLPVGVSINCGEDTLGGIASLQPCPSWTGSVLQATYPAAPRSALATRHLRAALSEELQAPLPPAQPEDERGLVATSGLSLQVSPQQLLNFTPDDNIVLWVACQDAFGLPLAYQYPSGSGSDVLACQASTNLSLNNAILYGQTSTQVTLSVASASVPAFTSLKLRLMPGTQQAITISCSISSRQRTLPPSTVVVRARPCRINEVVSDAMDACVRCDVGFVALLPSGSCQACPDQALCNTVDSNAVDNDTATGIIVPRDGMHSSPFAMELYPCPNPQTCSAAGRSALLTAYQAQLVRDPSSYNYTTWNQLMCATGYQGNFCGSCAEGYGLTRPAHCVRCTSKSSYDMLYFFLSSLLVVVPLVLALRASLNESGMMLKKSKEAEVEEPQELMAFDRLRTCASRFIKHSSVKSRDQSSCSQLIDSLNGSVTRFPMTSPPASNNARCPSAAVDDPTSCSQAAFLIASPMAQDKEPSNAQQTSPAHLQFPSTTDIKPIEHRCGHHASSLGLATSAGVEMHQVQTPDMEDSARSYAADDFGRTMGPATPARAQPQPSSTLSKQLVDWRPPPGMHIQWSRGWGPDSIDAHEAADVQRGQAVAEGGREQEEPAPSHLHPCGRQKCTTLLRRLPSPLAVGDVELDLMGSLPTSWGGAFPPSPDEQRPSAQTRVKFNPVIETRVQPTQSEADHQSPPKDNALPDKNGDDGSDAAGLVSPLLKVLVTYLQVACMVRYAPLKLPKVVEFIIDIAVTASTVPGSAVSLDCALPSGGHLSKATQRTLVSFFTPMTLLAIVLLIFTVLHTMQRLHTTKGEAIRGEDKITDEAEQLPHARGSVPKQKQNEASSQAEDIARSLWLRLVIATNTTVFVFFPGDELSDSSLIASLHLAPGTRLNLPGTWWNMDMEQQCFQGAHRTLALSLGIPGLLFIAGGIPIASAWYLALHSVEQRESDVQLRACWMFMYADYRTCRFFWESVVMLRKVVIAAAMVFLAITDIGLQVATSAIIVLLFLFLHLAARPYNNELLNKLELLSQAVVLTNLLLSAYLTYPTTSQVRVPSKTRFDSEPATCTPLGDNTCLVFVLQNWLLPYVLSMFILVLNMLVVCTFVWYLVLAMRDTLLYQAGLRHSDAVHLNIKGLTHAMQAEYGRFSPLTAHLLRIGLHLPSNLPQRIFTAGKRLLRFLLRCGAPAVDSERSPQPKITLQGVHRSTTFNRRRASTIASLMDSSSKAGTLPRYPSSLALSRSQSQATAHSSVSGNLSP
ncbi:uncharacterized protein HaLaN_07477 [Haematococcus lacustris]|uniref:TRP C-terminal domain-containing protein n=1 Tax=Haematococcus lacustris TaxID=44745 RepID=A0A699YZ65_HAELA|nr:uncharacterized protein HaLaN_07477 [Haematococcus lacustris]